MAKTGMNNNYLKQQNRGMILKLIATGECTSRIELAKRSRLSKMSVTNIVSEFIENNIVEEQDMEPIKGQGRNPISLTISSKAPKIIGVFIHRDDCTAVLCDLKLQILKKSVVPMEAFSSEQLLNKIYEVIDLVMPVNKERVIGIGVGAVGPVDIRRGIILNPPNYFDIRDFEVTIPLYEKYQLPVYMDSQYNCAALAEKYFGIGKAYHDFVFLGITNGIGSGIISDDRILRNSNGLTSEIGHVSIDWKGKRCSCGNYGCLEMYAGARIVERELLNVTKQAKSLKEFCLDFEKQDMKNIERSWKQKTMQELEQNSEFDIQQKVEKVFLEMMDGLACGLISVVNLVNPEAILVGHEGFYIPDRIWNYLEEKINNQKLSGAYQQIVVRKSFFKDEAHLRGCACAVLKKVFEGEIST